MTESLPIPTDNPVVREADQQIAVWDGQLRGLRVVNDDGYREVAEKLQQIKGWIGRLEAARTSITKPINEGLRRINAMFAAPKERLERLELTAKRALGEYSRAQEEKRRREQAAADERARKERERLEGRAAAAGAAGKTEQQEQLLERAEATSAPVIERAPPRVAGVTLRKLWRWRLKNAALVPRQYLKLDDTAINGAVRSLGDKADIPGIEVYEDTTVASGSV